MEDELVLKYIDLKVINDQLLILVAMINPSGTIEALSNDDMPTTKMVTLATGKLTC